MLHFQKPKSGAAGLRISQCRRHARVKEGPQSPQLAKTQLRRQQAVSRRVPSRPAHHKQPQPLPKGKMHQALQAQEEVKIPVTGMRRASRRETQTGAVGAPLSPWSMRRCASAACRSQAPTDARSALTGHAMSAAAVEDKVEGPPACSARQRSMAEAR